MRQRRFPLTWRPRVGRLPVFRPSYSLNAAIDDYHRQSSPGEADDDPASNESPSTDKKIWQSGMTWGWTRADTHIWGPISVTHPSSTTTSFHTNPHPPTPAHRRSDRCPPRRTLQLWRSATSATNCRRMWLAIGRAAELAVPDSVVISSGASSEPFSFHAHLPSSSSLVPSQRRGQRPERRGRRTAQQHSQR